MKHFYLIGLAILLAAAMALPVMAQDRSAPAASAYDLSWYTIAGGGATFNTDGSYSLGGTIGQPDADSMNGGAYSLAGGFWFGPSAIQHMLYLPLVLKDS